MWFCLFTIWTKPDLSAQIALDTRSDLDKHMMWSYILLPTLRPEKWHFAENIFSCTLFLTVRLTTIQYRLPIKKSILFRCQSDHQRQCSVKYQSNYQRQCSVKCESKCLPNHWKHRVENVLCKMSVLFSGLNVGSKKYDHIMCLSFYMCALPLDAFIGSC